MGNNTRKAFILAVLIAISALLVGCAGSKDSTASGEDTQAAETPIAAAAPEVTPTPTAEPTPTPTPTAEPTATPEPTPFVRTSFEIPDDDYVRSVVAELNVIDDDEYYFDYQFGCILFTDRYGQQRAIQIDMPEVNKSKKSYVLVDAHSGTELFSFNASDCKINYTNPTNLKDEHYFDEFYNFKKITPKAEIFEGVDPSTIRVSARWVEWMYRYTKPYLSTEQITDIMVGEYARGRRKVSTDMFARTRMEIAEFYARYCLPECIVTAAQMNPSLVESQDPVKQLG